jgi:CBS-domain-containing membrane protein
MHSSPKIPSPRLSPLVAALGSGLAMGSLFAVSTFCLGAPPSELLVASMGASAVLMFCVPHGELSGPWAVFGGHVASAVIGVTACRLIPETSLAGAVAVAAAIFTMLLLNCLHPPGGATALSAVVGGSGTTHGFDYVLSPVMLNVAVMLAVAYLFHLPGRRYPLPAVARRLFARRSANLA